MTRNKMMNIVEETSEIICKYEDCGYLENDVYVLMVSDNKFYFRNKTDNCVEIINYYNDKNNSKDEAKMNECLEKAYNYNLLVEL